MIYSKIAGVERRGDGFFCLDKKRARSESKGMVHSLYRFSLVAIASARTVPLLCGPIGR